MHVPSYNGSRCCKYRKRYPQEVIKLIAKKRSLWKKRMLRPDDLRIRWQYRDCVNALRSSCRQFVRVREESIVDANNLGTFYRHVNPQLTHRDNIGALVDSTGELITLDCQKADLLNTYSGSQQTMAYTKHVLFLNLPMYLRLSFLPSKMFCWP